MNALYERAFDRKVIYNNAMDLHSVKVVQGASDLSVTGLDDNHSREVTG